MSRVLRRSLLALLVLLLVLIVLVGVIVGTEAGTRFALDRARAFLPAGTEIGRIDGRLAGPLTLHDVAYTSEGLRVTVRRITLRWHPAALLDGVLEIEQLAVTGVRYTATEAPDEEAPPFELPERVEAPVAIHLEALAVTDVELARPGAAAPLAIDAIRLAGRFADATLRIDRLEIAAPLFDVRNDGPLTLASRGDYPLDVRILWQLRLPDYAPIDAVTDIGGNLRRTIAIEQTLAAPYNVELTAALEEPLGELTVDARLDVTALSLGAANATLPEVTFSLDALARGPVDRLAVRARLEAADAAGHDLAAELAATVGPESVAIETLVLNPPGDRSRIELAGRVIFAGTPRGDLRGEWQALRWPLTGAAEIVSASGRLEADGTLEAYTVAIDAELEIPERTDGHIELRARGDEDSLTASLAGDVLDGHLEGDAALTWSPVVEGRLTLRGRELDPGVVAAGWPGRIAVDLAVTGEMRGDAVTGRVQRLTATGRLREQPLELRTRGRYESGTAIVEELVAVLGGTRLEADGRLGESARFDWRITSDDLSDVLEGSGGQLSGSGSIAGRLPEARVAVRLDAEELRYQGYSLDTLTLDADLDLSGAQSSEVVLAARGGRAGTLSLEALDFEARGTPGAHRLALVVASNRGRADVTVDGGVAEPWGPAPEWQFTIDRATLAYPELAPWRLEAPAAGRLAAARMRIAEHCWASGAARLCLGGRRNPDALHAAFDLEGLTYAYFAPLLPQGLRASGALDAAGRVARTAPGPLTATLDVSSSAGEITLRETAGGDYAAEAAEAAEAAVEPVARTLVVFEPSELGFDLEAAGARAWADLNLAHGEVAVEARSPGAADGDWLARPISAEARLDLPDLSFLADLLPDVGALGGSIGGTVEVGGTLGAPEIVGRLALADGSAELLAAGITLTDVAMSVSGRGAEGIDLEASASSGGGTLSVDGTMSFAARSPNARIDLEGDAFQLVGTEEARLYASPDLTITAGAERIDVRGEVRIPRAEITPPKLPESAVTASDDVVLVGAEQDGVGAATGRAFHARVRIMLGDEVRFEGFGLKARFDGNVVATVEPNTPTTATGELTIVEGEYRAYGQGLVIDSGRIYFAGGPITEPALDIRAVRRPEEGILVGATVRGTLETPEFTLFSEPPMTQQEQLSYLVLGRSLDEASGGEGSALAQAALALSLRGGDFLAKNIGERLGVDTIGIETGSGEAGAASDPNAAQLVIGEYLGPKLYVSYGIGLFDPVSVLRMQYALSKRVELITHSSSESSGADLVYTLERGR